MTPKDIMRDLARDDIFPRDAMVAARAQRDAMVPVFVDLVERVQHQSIPSAAAPAPSRRR